jgi:hypothetical protein
MRSFSISLQTTFFPPHCDPTGPLPCGTSLLLEIVLIFEKYPLSVPEIITGTTLSVFDQLTQPELPTSIAIVQALKAFLH